MIFYKQEDKAQIPVIQENLIKKIEKAKIIQKNIYDIYNYLNTFFKKDERIEKYRELKDKTSITTLKDFDKLDKEAPSYNVLIRVGNKIMEFSESNIFMCIFNYFNNKQNENEDSALENTVNTYNQFYDILKSKTINNNDEDILTIISKSFKTFNELEENITIISKLGKVNGEKKIDLYNSVMNNDENQTIEKIVWFYRKKELREFMKSVLKILI